MAAEAMAAEAVEPTYLALVLFDDLFVGSPTGVEVLKMDPELWSCLPEVLLEAVLLLLPASSQARFRAVSKAWLHLLTSKPFRKRSAELAFSRCEYICGVRHSKDRKWVPAEPNPRYKVHHLSLEFLPSKFQGESVMNIRIGQGLMVIALANNSQCVVNLANRTWRVLPKSTPPGYFWETASVISVSQKQEEAPSFTVYVEEGYDPHQDMLDRHWSVYNSTKNSWESMVIKAEKPRDYRAQGVCITEDSVHIAEGRGTVEFSVYNLRSGDLVHNLPAWQREASIRVGFMMQSQQVVTMAFSTSAENLCEVWRVDEGNSEWVRWAVMPHGVLWPQNDVFFFTVWRVQVVGEFAFLSFVEHDRPVYTWELFDDWFSTWTSPNFRLPRVAKLVAFDVVRGTWKILSDQWPYTITDVCQPNPTIDVSWTSQVGAPP